MSYWKGESLTYPIFMFSGVFAISWIKRINVQKLKQKLINVSFWDIEVNLKLSEYSIFQDKSLRNLYMLHLMKIHSFKFEQLIVPTFLMCLFIVHLNLYLNQFSQTWILFSTISLTLRTQLMMKKNLIMLKIQTLVQLQIMKNLSSIINQ